MPNALPMQLRGLSPSSLAPPVCWYTYVGQVLAPTLRPGDVVVMGNLSVHKIQGTEAMTTATGAKLIYLPPYSSDWSPIEPCWSKIKTRLRGMKARTREALDTADENH